MLFVDIFLTCSLSGKLLRIYAVFVSFIPFMKLVCGAMTAVSA